MKPFLIAFALLAACAAPAGSEEASSPAGLQSAPLPADAPFREEILRFAELDRQGPIPECPVLFVGSSSIRMWSSLEADMAPLPVLNRGFGGSTVSDVNRYFDRVVARYQPRAIVYYAGENDLDLGQPPEEVAARFRDFLEMKRNALGGTPVFYISAKPSRARLSQLAKQSELNAIIRDLAGTRSDLEYIDVASAMMRDGQPRDIFLGDGLHMQPSGYLIWRELVKDAFRRKNVAGLPCAR